MNNIILSRGSGKTSLQLMQLLEYLKNNSKIKEEKEYYEAWQEVWSEFNTGLLLGYWNRMKEDDI